MITLAELNENNVCIGVKQVNSLIEDGRHIVIPSLDFDYIWRKYDFETQTWSEEKFEPESTAPLSEFEKLKQENESNKQAIAELTVLISMMGGI